MDFTSVTATPTPSDSSPSNSSSASVNLTSSSSSSSPRAPPLPPHSPAASVLIVLVVAVIILGTVVGNVLVVVAVFTSRALRAPQNLFLVSLASADILVATLVIPFSLANEVMGYWYFGSTWCSFYLALDVLFCTSSIVHLCAISLDRYWSVTKAVSYNRKRTPRRIKAMIGVVWLISVVISSPPLVMTQAAASASAEEEEEVEVEEECLLINQTWYILSSCLVSFFAPGVIMILVYCRIYRVAKQRASTVFVAKNAMERQPSQSETCFAAGAATSAAARTCRRSGGKSPYEPESNVDANNGNGGVVAVVGVHRRGELDDINLEEKSGEADAKTSAFSSALRFPRRGGGGGVKTEEAKEAAGAGDRLRPPLPPPPPPPPPPSCASISWVSSDHCSHHRLLLPSPVAPPRGRTPPPPPPSSLSKSKVAQMREKRFTVVLAVVMGVFVLCWFPFFFTYSLRAVCSERCSVPDSLFDLFFWIGYCNSCLNPVIYTVFNRDFRRAFSKILFQTHRPS